MSPFRKMNTVGHLRQSLVHAIIEGASLLTSSCDNLIVSCDDKNGVEAQYIKIRYSEEYKEDYDWTWVFIRVVGIETGVVASEVNMSWGEFRQIIEGWDQANEAHYAETGVTRYSPYVNRDLGAEEFSRA